VEENSRHTQKKGNCIKNQTSGKKKVKYSGSDQIFNPLKIIQINLHKIAVKTFTLQQLEYLGGNRS
jgi:hypothetical protein